MLELAAFLGNPGREYSHNRHNAGFMLAEKLPFYSGLSWQKKFKGLYAAIDSGRIAEFLPAGFDTETAGRAELPSRIHFIKPETYMNLSGESVQAAASFFKIQSDRVLVVHDELELPLGTVSLKFSGGLGGHNGLRSMKACFGTADFWRLRIGIGRPAGSGEGVIDWVLSDFSAVEAETLDRVLESAVGLFLMAVRGNPESLLKEWGKKKVGNE